MTTRRVRTVALTAPSEALVQRGVTLLADALRTATLPGAAPGRLLVVRSLSVGDIDAAASPARLALAIERRLASLDAAAVHFADPAAPRAPAVYFDDDAEPYVALGLRLVRRQPVDAWFWPLAAPAWYATHGPAGALRAVLFGVQRTRAGPGALLRLLDALVEQGMLDPVLAVLSEPDGDLLLREHGWSRPTMPAEPAWRAAGAAPPVAARWMAAARPWLVRWPPDDPRSVWLVAMMLAAARPAHLLDPTLPAVAASVARDVAVDRGPSMAARAAARLVSDAGGRVEEAPAIAPRPREGAASGHAGLFFAVQVMARLGMGAFLAAHPALVDLDLPWRLLDRLAGRLGISDDDPVRVAIGHWPALADAPRLGFAMPPAWRGPIALADPLIVRRDAGERGRRLLLDRTGALPIALWRGRAPAAVRQLVAGSTLRRRRAAAPGRDAAVLLDAWLTAMRRWSRRHARMGLVELVRRRGRVIATRTHVDLVFELSGADLRIRKAGLDLDPGWVAWLGRVVAVHYRDD